LYLYYLYYLQICRSSSPVYTYSRCWCNSTLKYYWNVVLAFTFSFPSDWLIISPLIGWFLFGLFAYPFKTSISSTIIMCLTHLSSWSLSSEPLCSLLYSLFFYLQFYYICSLIILASVMPHCLLCALNVSELDIQSNLHLVKR
jgi:hypothetical protein